MTKSNHTPTPWHTKKSRSKGDNLISIDSENRHITLHMIESDEDIANAALIVHRVNNWDKLVEALEYWLPREIPLPHGVDTISQTHNAKWHQAKVALALAKEGK